MDGVRRGARSVLKYFAPLYVVLIVVQVFLAGEGIFRMNDIKHSDDCNKAAAHCISNSKPLDAHRFLGFLLTEPLAVLFLIAALLAWFPDTRLRTISILAPIVTALQLLWAGIGGWAGGIHPVGAFVALGMFGWLTRVLRQEQAGTADAAVPATAPTG
jgi:hypothetical protein